MENYSIRERVRRFDYGWANACIWDAHLKQFLFLGKLACLLLHSAYRNDADVPLLFTSQPPRWLQSLMQLRRKDVRSFASRRTPRGHGTRHSRRTVLDRANDRYLIHAVGICA